MLGLVFVFVLLLKFSSAIHNGQHSVDSGISWPGQLLMLSGKLFSLSGLHFLQLYNELILVPIPKDYYDN